MSTVKVPDEEEIYYIALLVNNGWRYNKYRKGWKHPQDKKCVRQGTFFTEKEVNELWTLEEAIEEVEYETDN